MRILIPSSSKFHSDFNAIKPKLHHYFKKIIYNLFNEINLNQKLIIKLPYLVSFL